jgi:hypothetical protein
VIGFSYSFLHYLRRVAAYVSEYPNWKAQPFPDDEDPADDPLVDKYSTEYNHLISHSDCDGYYLPIEFEEVLFDFSSRVPGGMIGSSFRLREELIAMAPALGIILNKTGDLNDDEAARIDTETEGAPLRREKMVWLALYEASRLSIQYKAAIYFG